MILWLKQLITTFAFPWKKIISIIIISMRKNSETLLPLLVVWNYQSSHARPATLALVHTSRRLWPYYHFILLQTLFCVQRQRSTCTCTRIGTVHYTSRVPWSTEKTWPEHREKRQHAQKKNIEIWLNLKFWNKPIKGELCVCMKIRCFGEKDVYLEFCNYSTQQKVETVIRLNRVWEWWRVFTRFGR